MVKKYSYLIIITLLTFIISSCKMQMDYDPNYVTAHIITYKTDKGTTPEQIALAEGAILMPDHLPSLVLPTGYFDFNGWYIGNTKINPGYKINGNITLTAKWDFNHYDYDTTDYSMNVFSPTGNSNYSVDGQYTKITVSTTSISNFVIPKKENGINYALNDVYGFEFKMKCDTSIQWAGLEWIDKPSYDCYFFEVYGDGTFKVVSKITVENNGTQSTKWTDEISLKPANSHIIKQNFNTIRMYPTRNSDFEIYVNDYKVGTIEREKLKIIPGQIALCGTAKKSGSKGSGWFKLMSYEQVKK